MAIDEIRTTILALSLIVTNGMSIFLYLKNRNNAKQDGINEKLFKLQDISLNNPFLEDKRFAKGWVKFRNNYNRTDESDYDYDNELNKKYLQYEQYCEMLFNFISESYSHCSNEEKLLNKVDFKSWVRVHEMWWNNPLQDYSNHDTYDKQFCNMIDGWLK